MYGQLHRLFEEEGSIYEEGIRYVYTSRLLGKQYIERVYCFCYGISKSLILYCGLSRHKLSTSLLVYVSLQYYRYAEKKLSITSMFSSLSIIS